MGARRDRRDPAPAARAQLVRQSGQGRLCDGAGHPRFAFRHRLGTGKLAPINQIEVGSELSGLVTKVVVDVNDRVVAGQPLALVDPSRFQDTVNQSKAALDAAVATVGQNQATVSYSNAQLARLQEVSRLSGGRVPAKTEMEQAIADRDRAVANLRAAQANAVSARAALSSNTTQLTRTVIRSPVNGVVLARQIEPGQTVAASFNTPTLFVIAQDLSTMKLEVAIDEADVGEVKQGQNATFTVDAFPGKTFPRGDHPRRSRFEPERSVEHDCDHHHGAGRLLCRHAQRRQCRSAIAPRHDGNGRYRDQRPQQCAARPQCGAALQADRDQPDGGGKRWNRRRARPRAADAAGAVAQRAPRRSAAVRNKPSM